ncbi:MAG: hypothetical protein RIC56_18765 [Pseudomonadales bacterium]
MTEPDRDPLDILLREAFAADQARSPAPDVAERVIARIRRRQFWRRLVLGAGAGVGVIVGLNSARPAVTALITAIGAQAPGTWNDGALVVGALALGIGAWWLVLEEEAG